jgi:hypothetical protein
MMQKGQRQCETSGVGTVKARASEHHIAVVLQEVRVNAVPKEFDRTLVAIGREYAGTPKLEKLKFIVARQQCADIEFSRGVETAIVFGKCLPQKAIRPNDDRTIQRAAIVCGVVDNQQVVANGVIAIDIPAGKKPCWIWDGGAFLVKDAIAQFLRLPNFGGRLCQPDFQCAYPAEALRRPMRAGGPSLQSAVCLQRRYNAWNAKAAGSRTKTLE